MFIGLGLSVAQRLRANGILTSSGLILLQGGFLKQVNGSNFIYIAPYFLDSTLILDTSTIL
jgi:hypothetical protein